MSITVDTVGLWIAAALSAAALTWAFGLSLGQFAAIDFVLVFLVNDR